MSTEILSYRSSMATEIQGRKAETLAKTLGKGDSQSTREKEVMPTRTERPDRSAISGPPLSPVQVVSVPEHKNDNN